MLYEVITPIVVVKREDEVRLGAFDIYPVTDGRFRLDGGAMFGVVPKVLWEKCCAADHLNRIPLSLTCLLIRANGKNILVDTGLGSKEDDKFHRTFAVERTPTLLESLKRLGLGREDIHMVINTHLVITSYSIHYTKLYD